MQDNNLVEVYGTITACELQIIVGATQFLILNKKLVQILSFPGIKSVVNIRESLIVYFTV